MAKIPEIDLRDNYTKNYIINGDFDISQRGSFTISATPWEGYVADRFSVERSTTLVNVTVNRSSAILPTLSQSGHKSNYSGLITIAGAYTPTGAEFLTMRQGIEGFNFKNLIGKKCLLSFWVRSNKTGIYTLCVRNASVDPNNRIHWLTEYTINNSDVWEKKIIELDFGSGFLAMPTTSYSLTNLMGIDILWCLAAGATRKTGTLNSWHNQGTNTAFGSNNQVNFLDNASNFIRFSQVQLVIGQQELPFRLFGKDIGGEISACQRYYEKSYNLETAPGTPTNAGEFGTRLTNSATAQAIRIPIIYKARKRVAPSVIRMYSPSTGAIDKIDMANIVLAGTPSLIQSGESMGEIEASVSAVQMGNAHINAQWTVDVEL